MSTCTGTDATARAIEARTGGAVENMEGAAVAHVAHLHGVPVGEVRGISNIVTDRDTEIVAAEGCRDRSAGPGGWLTRRGLSRKPDAVNFAFSPCPNDTFAFHALVHGLVPGVRVTPHLDDIEALNIRAARSGRRGDEGVDQRLRPRPCAIATCCCAPVARPASASARSSSRRSKRDVGGRIAIPGERTTAALLLRQLGRFDTVVMRFDQIEDAVLRGDADCGVLIHEGRFTYQAKGLTLLTDLGEVWEERMHCPLPLAAIAIRRDLAPTLAPAIDRALRASVEYAFAHPEASRDYVAAHAQEMDPGVTERHIQLYVNDYTVALDEAAVMKMLEWGEREGVFPPADNALPIFVVSLRLRLRRRGRRRAAAAARRRHLAAGVDDLLREHVDDDRVVAQRGEIGGAQQLLLAVLQRRADRRPSLPACSDPSGPSCPWRRRARWCGRRPG